MSKLLVRLGTVGLFTALAITSAAAQQQQQQQQPQDSKWEAWLGCWRSAQSAPMRCIVPASAPTAALIFTVDSGRVVARDTIDASGTARTIAEQGCAGDERAVWSNDNRRVFIHSDVTCGAGVKRAANSIVVISPFGEWLDVQTILAGTNAIVRTAHYQQVPVTRADLPPELANVPAMLDSRHMSIVAARTAAASALDVADIAEAVRRVDTTSVQAWLVERKTQFVLNAQKLVALADAGVPGSVTDVMIGASYPDHFAMQPARVSSASEADYDLSPLDSARIAREYLRDRYRYRYGYDFGYSPFYGYGYAPYGSYYYGPSYYGSTYYSGPVVTVKDNGGTGHGQVVKGRGYTSGGTSSSGSTGSSGSSTSSATSSSASSSSSAGGSGSAAASSSGGGDRTAHPRPPL